MYSRVMAGLDATQVEHYRRDGHLFPISVFSSDTAADLSRELADIVALANSHTGLRHPAQSYLRNNAHVVSELAARLGTSDGIVDPVASIIGDHVLLWMAEIFIKDPHSGHMVSMHQDLTYWGFDDTGFGGAADEITAWLALSDVTVENGAMQYVTGSHLLGQAAHVDTFDEANLLSRGQHVDVEYDRAALVDVELKAGEMSLHHGHMFHGSGPNVTDYPRMAMVFRYVTPAVSQVVGSKDYAVVARGINWSNNFTTTAAATSDFAPHALDVFDEIYKAQGEALGEGAEQSLKHTHNTNAEIT